MEVSSRRLAIVQHRHPPARGLLSLISLLRAFPLTGINRNQSKRASNTAVGGSARGSSPGALLLGVGVYAAFSAGGPLSARRLEFPPPTCSSRSCKPS